MENLSHSAAGLVIGELIHRSLPSDPNPEHQKTRRRLLLVTSWAANNFPDLDLVLTPLLPAPLGYLLHHRGHTHTLLYALPQALLLGLLIFILWPSARRLLKVDAATRMGFTIAIVSGFGLHMWMDYLNSYGIHPFHPFDSRWYFGDMIFIVEPFFWAALATPLITMIQRTWLKSVLFALLIGLPLAFTLLGLLPWASFAALVLVGILLATLQWRAKPRSTLPLALGVALAMAFVILQSAASMKARAKLSEELKALDPENRVVDAAISSLPTNPACWMFTSLEANESARTYSVRKGVLSLIPGILPASSCPRMETSDGASAVTSPSYVISSTQTGDLNQIRALKKENCHFEAWLRFARIPMIVGTQASDLRFSGRTPRGNFSMIDLSSFEGQTCSPFIPQWEMPRKDLLLEP